MSRKSLDGHLLFIFLCLIGLLFRKRINLSAEFFFISFGIGCYGVIIHLTRIMTLVLYSQAAIPQARAFPFI